MARSEQDRGRTEEGPRGSGHAGQPGRLERVGPTGGPAFEDLVRDHYRQIHATAFRLLGNHEDAEDLTQECFVRAHASLAWYRGGSFGAWLRSILVHLVRDRFRRAGRRPCRTPLVGDEAAAGSGGPVGELRRGELLRVVEEAIADLPDNLRIALVLRTREGLGYEEISAATGVTPATARTQVMKARRALMASLAPYLEEREP